MTRTRQFPSYTTKELKSHLRNELTTEMRSKIEAEIVAREAGESKVRVIPQIQGGMPIPRLGRM